MANKLLKPKRGNVANLGKLPIEDGSLIFAYDNDAPSSTVLVDIGERRLGLASSYAAYADNAGQLGGHDPDYFAPASSLIDFADKTAFNQINEAINSTIQLTRANGEVVNRVINNVANAGTADWAKDSNALGGSSLQEIVDKIENQTGGGSAFIAAASTDSTLELTRSNNQKVLLTFDNISHAGTSKVAEQLGIDSIGSTSIPIYLEQGVPTPVNSIASTFIESVLIDGTNLDLLRTPGIYYAVGGNNNSNKPNGVDAFGLQIFLSSAGWYTQVLYASNNIQKSYIRYYNPGTSSWSNWEENNRLNTKDLSGYVLAPTDANPNKVWRTDNLGNPFWGSLDDGIINSLAATVTFGSGSSAMIDQNEGEQRQRINIFDNSSLGENVFSFQQSINSGLDYVDLFAIKNNGVVQASTFLGNLEGLAKNSQALEGSSLNNILDVINDSISANDAMRYLGTLGDSLSNPTITQLPSTAKVGSAYKVISDGIYGKLEAEIGDLVIYAPDGWTLIPSGDDGNVYVGGSKNSTFPYKENNLVVSIGDQKVTSIENVSATAGTIKALATSVTNVYAVNGTINNIVGNLDGNAKNADTVDNFHAINSSALTLIENSDKIVLAKNIVDYIDAQAFATTAEISSALSWIEF